MKKFYIVADPGEAIGRDIEKSLCSEIKEIIDDNSSYAIGADTAETALKKGIEYFEEYEEDTEALALIEVTIRVIKSGTKPESPWKWEDMLEKKAK